MAPWISKRDPNLCQDCQYCRKWICRYESCIGCQACHVSCPYDAVKMEERPSWETITIYFDDKPLQVTSGIPIKEALQLSGFPISPFPKGDGIFVPCGVGGCMSCAMEVDGVFLPICVTQVQEGMKIQKEFSHPISPLRIVHGFQGHPVGGVGTPWNLKASGRNIEVACFSAGCNLRCPQCQNWTTTYCGKGVYLTPEEAAISLTRARKREEVDRMAISGGESTLNRPWLIQFLNILRKLNPDKEARLHVDTNGTFLTNEYVDELFQAGMTDVGIDLKAIDVETYCRITGIEDRKKASLYLRTSWEAVRYISENYKDRLFLGVGIPYNRDLISMEEVERIGKEISNIDPNLQVCVLDYRPEFRRGLIEGNMIQRPSYQEMVEIYHLLRGTGLSTVLCQTPFGHIGPHIPDKRR
ncbi:MAG: radical SAM protein [Syntrophaceae bacterium]|nr:radical SAM protein [Syntrophaceae bacterium]